MVRSLEAVAKWFSFRRGLDDRRGSTELAELLARSGAFEGTDLNIGRFQEKFPSPPSRDAARLAQDAHVMFMLISVPFYCLQ
jgi:hypothetical protein